MKRIEAIALLVEYLPLAYRLAAQGVDIELTDKERGVLAGFIRIWQTALLSDPDIQREAGLDSHNMANLSYMAAQVQAEEMRRQHVSGEQVDG